MRGQCSRGVERKIGLKKCQDECIYSYVNQEKLSPKAPNAQKVCVALHITILTVCVIILHIQNGINSAEPKQENDMFTLS
jgi:hypothetical protein